MLDAFIKLSLSGPAGANSRGIANYSRRFRFFLKLEGLTGHCLKNHEVILKLRLCGSAREKNLVDKSLVLKFYQALA